MSLNASNDVRESACERTVVRPGDLWWCRQLTNCYPLRLRIMALDGGPLVKREKSCRCVLWKIGRGAELSVSISLNGILRMLSLMNSCHQLNFIEFERPFMTNCSKQLEHNLKLAFPSNSQHTVQMSPGPERTLALLIPPKYPPAQTIGHNCNGPSPGCGSLTE